LVLIQVLILGQRQDHSLGLILSLVLVLALVLSLDMILGLRLCQDQDQGLGLILALALVWPESGSLRPKSCIYEQGKELTRVKPLMEIYSKDGHIALPASIRLGWSDGGKHSNLLLLSDFNILHKWD
jgi:hypothetical protein